MIKIHLKNIQAIEDCEFVLDKPGIVEFKGNNSNGKSILTKVLLEITTGGILNKKKRLPLIRRYTEEGSVIILRDKQCLSIVLRTEIKDCYCIWIPDVTNPANNITRALKEGGYEEFLEELGFKSFKEDNICLQIAPTRGAVPFVTTSYQTNAKIAKSILEDFHANKFVKSYEQETMPAIRAKVSSIETEIKRITFAEEQLNLYDYKPYLNLFNKLKDEIAHASLVYIPKKFNLPIPTSQTLEPLFLLCDTDKIIETISEPFSLDVKIRLDMTQLDNWKSLAEGVCPTCGQKLINSHNCITT